jgi:hypothetical protein
LVVDASVAAKWFLDEDLCGQARQVLRNGYSLHAPDFLLLEMDSIFCKRIRRGDITPDDGEEARLVLRRVPIKHHAFSAYLDRAYEIANLAQQSIYDSLYVALALLLDAQVVTADRKLYNAIIKGPLRKYVLWVGDIKV